jgi:transposase
VQNQPSEGSVDRPAHLSCGQVQAKYSAEDKIRVVIEGLRGEASVAELCRKEGISQSLYNSWSKEFLEAGKSRLAGDTKRNADASEVKEMRGELEQLKLLVAELSLDNRRLTPALAGGAREKSLHGLGEGN